MFALTAVLRGVLFINAYMHCTVRLNLQWVQDSPPAYGAMTAAREVLKKKHATAEKVL